MMKKQNGITLIALVITIIVLLILAGVSIAMLTGDNGILTKSRTAKEESGKAEIREAVILAISEIYANKIDEVSTNNGPTTLDASTIAKIAIKNNSSLSVPDGKENASSESGDAASPINIYLSLNNKGYQVTYTAATTDEAASVTVSELP